MRYENGRYKILSTFLESREYYNHSPPTTVEEAKSIKNKIREKLLSHHALEKFTIRLKLNAWHFKWIY